MPQTLAGKEPWPRFKGTEDALVLCAGRTSATADLLAIGSQSRLQVLQVLPRLAPHYGRANEGEAEGDDRMRRGEASGARFAVPESLIRFDVEAPVTAIAWSPVAVGPLPVAEHLGSDDGKGGMRIEVAAALEDGRVVVFSHSAGQTTSLALGQVSGRVNSLDWLNVGDISYLAAAQANGTLTIWTLEPTEDEDDVRDGQDDQPGILAREPHIVRQAFTYPFPLLTAAFHPHATGTLLVLDAAGSLRMLDWLDPTLSSRTNKASSLGSSLTARKLRAQHTFVDPRAYSNARSIGRGGGAVASGSATNAFTRSTQSGSASWKPQDENVVGALIDGRWSIWDSRTSAGNGLPVEQGESYPERGGDGFKWCPTNAQLFMTFSTASNSAASNGTSQGAGSSFGAAEDYPLTIYDRSSLTLSGAPRRISNSELLPYEIRVSSAFHGIPAKTGQLGASAGGGVVKGERVRDAEWVGSTLGGGVRSGGIGAGGAGGGLGDVVAVAMGREVVFVSLALNRN
ncbi:unnamed protein product [Tilletia controversa]|nr:unnamed protein product [Tilletia controversa]